MKLGFFPKVHLVAVLLTVAAFALAHVLGWREHTALLSGTLPAGPEETLMGLFYALGWFLFVLVAPISALAATLEVVGYTLVRVFQRRRASRATAQGGLR